MHTFVCIFAMCILTAKIHMAKMHTNMAKMRSNEENNAVAKMHTMSYIMTWTTTTDAVLFYKILRVNDIIHDIHKCIESIYAKYLPYGSSFNLN